MSHLSKLRRARESYPVKLREFVRIFAKSPHIGICFFEGEDVKYFGPRLELINPDFDWEAVNCGGKEILLQLFTFISVDGVYSKSKSVFFVDRDFDDPASLPRSSTVYITPCYSVENLYVTEDVVKRILRSEFGLSEQDDEDGVFSTCVALFRARLIEFLDATELANCWCAFQRTVPSNNGGIVRVNFSGLNLNQMVRISLDGVVKNYAIDDLEAATGSCRRITEAELAVQPSRWSRDDRNMHFRGKFQAIFMRVFICYLKEDASDQSPRYFRLRRTVPFSISDRNFLSDLSQYAETPNCLRDFIGAIN
jgi:hypothetical protein